MPRNELVVINTYTCPHNLGWALVWHPEKKHWGYCCTRCSLYNDRNPDTGMRHNVFFCEEVTYETSNGEGGKTVMSGLRFHPRK